MTNHRYKINDIASLYSRAQWEKMQPLPEDEYGYFELFVPSLSDGIRLDVRMLRGEMPTQSGFVIVINDSFIEVVDPYYLCFEWGTGTLIHNIFPRKSLSKCSLN